MYVGLMPFDLKEIIKCIFPILSKQYWYLTAYTGMYLASPFINKAVNNMDTVNLKRITLIIFFFVIAAVPFGNPFQFDSGYSCIWLCILYLFGAVMRKNGVTDSISKEKSIIFAFVSTVTGMMLHNFMSSGEFVFFNNTEIAMRYDSLFIVLNAIFLLAFFSKLKFKEGMEKFLKRLIPLNLGVYVIHVNPVIWEYVMKERFSYLGSYSTAAMVVIIIIAAAVIYNICICFELLRTFVFEKIKINKSLEMVGRKLWTILT